MHLFHLNFVWWWWWCATGCTWGGQIMVSGQMYRNLCLFFCFPVWIISDLCESVRWFLPGCQTECPYTSQTDLSCHFSVFWRCRKPAGETPHHTDSLIKAWPALLVCHYSDITQSSDLQDGVGHEHFVPDGVEKRRARTADSVILQNLLGGLRLPRSALSGDEDEVIVELCQHGLVGVVRQGVAVVMHANFRLQSRALPSHTNVEMFIQVVTLTCEVEAQKSWCPCTFPSVSYCRCPALCRGWLTPTMCQCTSKRMSWNEHNRLMKTGNKVHHKIKNSRLQVGPVSYKMDL